MRPFLSSVFAAVVGLASANQSLAETPLPEIPLAPIIPTAASAAPAERSGLEAIPAYLPDIFPLSSFAFTDRAPSSPLESLLSLTTDPSTDPLPDAGVPCDCPPVASLPSFGGPLCTRPTLTGNWGGFRTRLAERGITWGLYSTNFFSDVANGGNQESFQYRGRMDYLLNVDGQKAGLWQGSFMNLHAESVYGQSINGYTGTLMPVSVAQAVPVPNGYVTALTGVKFTQALSEKFIVYGGKLNLLDEFNQPFTGGARGVNGFWNTSLVFNPVFTRTIPYSTYGFGAAYLKDLQPVLALTVLDANDTPTVSGFNTFFDNGVVLLPQINIPTNFFGMPGHQGLIGTWSSRKYRSTDRATYLDVLRGAPISTIRTAGAWSLAYMFDQALYVSPCDPKRMWGVFGNAGIADTNPSPVRWASNIGFGGSSPFQGRKLDSFGVGYFYTGLNSSFKNLAPRALPLRDEQGVEMFYNVGVTPWCHITPDLQVVIPASRNADTVLLVGLRARIDF